MTWPGSPTIYYGDEAGLCGWTDPDDRRPYPWGAEDEAMLELHRALAALRAEYPMLRSASVEFLYNDYGFISYGRWDGHGQVIAVAINNTGSAKDVMLPVWKAGFAGQDMKRLLSVCGGRVSREQRNCPVDDGCARVTVPGESALVLAG